MGILEKIGGSFKKVGKALAEEIKTRQEISRTKRRILDMFEMKDLKNICKYYGIGEPSPYEEDFLTGEKYKKKITREDYIDWIVDKLTLEQIKNFCDKHRIRIDDITKKEAVKPETIEKREESREVAPTQIEFPTNKFDSILNSIEQEFEPEDVRDENDFEKQLTQFLKIKFPNRVERQVDTPKGKVDIVIDNRYAIELKIADNKGKLRDLVGQVYSYKKIYNEVAVVLLDIGRMSPSEIKEYVDDYDKLGVKTIVLKGILKPRGKKTKQISIQFK